MGSTIIDRGPYRRQGIKAYVANMSKANDHVIFDDRIAMILSQQGYSWEERPRSIYDPQQLWDALNIYDKPTFEGWDDHLERGARLAYKVFSRDARIDEPFLRALNGEEEISAAVDLSKSSGLPNLTKKLNDLTYALDREYQVRVGKKIPSPCIAFKRTQADNKTRLVWGYPFEMTIMEARFARPLINKFLNKRSTMAFGLYKSELGAIIESEIRKEDGYIYALDYSKFDTKASKRLIKRAFSILKTWFSLDDLHSLGWNKVVNYFLHTTIVMPDGHLYVGKSHGIPSGSYFTQLIGSIINTILMGAINSRFRLNLSWREFLVLGDDSIFSSNKKISIGAIAEFVKQYGYIVNVKKSKEEFHFLGAYWKCGMPDNSVDELVHKALFPETYRQYDQGFQGAYDVLSSLATQYASGHKLLPRITWSTRRMDLEFGIHTGRYLTGSDRLQRSYATLRGVKTSIPRLSARSLL